MSWKCDTCAVVKEDQKHIYWVTIDKPGTANRFCKKCFPAAIEGLIKGPSRKELESNLEKTHKILKQAITSDGLLRKQVAHFQEINVRMEAQNRSLINQLNASRNSTNNLVQFSTALSGFKDIYQFYKNPALDYCYQELSNQKLTLFDTQSYISNEIQNIIENTILSDCQSLKTILENKINQQKLSQTTLQELLNAQLIELKKDDILSAEDIELSLCVLKKKIKQKNFMIKQLEDCLPAVEQMRGKHSYIRFNQIDYNNIYFD